MDNEYMPLNSLSKLFVQKVCKKVDFEKFSRNNEWSDIYFEINHKWPPQKLFFVQNDFYVGSILSEKRPIYWGSFLLLDLVQFL